VPQPRFATHPSKYQANKILAEFQRFAHVKYRIRSNEANKKCGLSLFGVGEWVGGVVVLVG